MSRSVTVALVGTSGYGSFYLNPFLDSASKLDVKLTGVIDPFPDRCPRRTELASRNIPCYPTLEEFFNNHTAELVIISSPTLHNATAHYLHHMLYLLGPTRETSATPTQVQAELYRANRIDNFDTAAFRCRTDAGAEVLFYTSHAVPSDINPVFCLEFENALVSNGNGFVAHLAGGGTRRYGAPEAQGDCKLTQVLESVRTGDAPSCDIETAIPQVLCVNAAQESMPRVRVFPSDMVNIEGHPPNELTWVKGLSQALIQCWGMGILPSEHGDMPWARPSRLVDVTQYTSFPQNPVLLGGAEAGLHST